MKRTLMTGRATALVLAAALALVALQCSESEKKLVSLTPDEIEQVCVNVTSCTLASEPGSSGSVSDCIGGMMWMGMSDSGYVDVSDMISCVEDAGSDCAELELCYNEGRPLQACDAASYESHCEGTMMVTCEEGMIRYFDCTRLDPIYGDTICTAGSEEGVECVSGRTCEGTGMQTACDGEVLELCMEGDFMRLDCRLVGAHCRLYMPGIYYCIGTGAACDDADATWCSGTNLVRCLGGKEARFDCAEELGPDFTCFQAEGEEADCGPAGTECDAEQYVDHCDGNQLVYCRFGTVDRVDCTLLGYAACVPTEATAYCR
jgi:hypothetical protein